VPTTTRLNPTQRILTMVQFDQLIANGRNRDQDHAPVVKFFGRNATWLISEIDPQDPFLAFGLCDLGMGSPELGIVNLRELAMPLVIERDLRFVGKHPMSVYAYAAQRAEHIEEYPKKGKPDESSP